MAKRVLCGWCLVVVVFFSLRSLKSGNCDVIECRAIHRISIEMILVRWCARRAVDIAMDFGFAIFQKWRCEHFERIKRMPQTDRHSDKNATMSLVHRPDFTCELHNWIFCSHQKMCNSAMDAFWVSVIFMHACDPTKNRFGNLWKQQSTRTLTHNRFTIWIQVMLLASADFQTQNGAHFIDCGTNSITGRWLRQVESRKQCRNWD